VPLPESAPRPFRDEAKVEALGCPACGAPLQLHGFAATREVTCAHCGSTVDPREGTVLARLRGAQRELREPILPLYSRGTLEGVEWEILGVVWRGVTIDGVRYAWQELLLFNPWRGYRWLVYSMSDGHWSLGRDLGAAPEAASRFTKQRSVRARGTKYRHFQTAAATTEHVQGEFPWQVRAGDVARIDDFVAPPFGLSIERSEDESGTDVAFTRSEWLAPSTVWAAFRRPGTPPPLLDVGALQPSPVKGQGRFFGLSLAALLVAWLVATIAYVGARADRVVLEESALPFAPLVRELELQGSGSGTTAELRFTATPLSNSWAFAEIALIPLAGGEAYVVGLESALYFGVTGGESWREDDSVALAVLGDLPTGRYRLEVSPQASPELAAQGAAASWDLRVTQDVPLARYVFLPLLVILGFPLVPLLRAWRFEARRWANSDYAETT
jgi:hypothetical protein